MDLISRQDAIEVVQKLMEVHFDRKVVLAKVWDQLKDLPSAQPEIPPYVAEIEAEYKKWVNIPYIRKPLAKALYEVWKKHDREDVERRTDEEDGWLWEQGCTAWMTLPEPWRGEQP